MLESLQALNPFCKHGYVPLTAVPASYRVQTHVKITIAVIVLISVAALLHPLGAAQQYVFNSSADNGPIPSIVHYVYIKKDDDSVLNFHFAHFLTLFASVMYINPSRIYIHTDYSDTDIASAVQNGNTWTRKVLTTFPEIVVFNPVVAPQFAGPNEGRKIDAIQHKSDFIRWDEIAKTGGIYLDWDVVVLQPLTPLLNAGFAFVAGRQYGGAAEDGRINGTINNGAFMTKPNSAMARIMLREQTAGFNGAWEYNLQFLTSVAERLVHIPNQALICDRHAFAPTHWFAESKDALFLANDGRPSPEPSLTNSTDVMDIYDNMVANRRRRLDWEMDLSATYMLHAFGQGQHNNDITPKRILARTSNYGVATWAIVKRMKEEGHVKGHEEEG
ncbi:hypothetical protein BDV95DRAFT_581809 [Massariosphaeria phaeospora]|uniref:Nucleotide-diphospho-sugar transferase n=1 Tax=Massariosphaeria phaeospora TaxID=100035 RepID=A0A7C8I0X7_9PLEO|nr:hypothetical protein BDV95DRAFT_581809 [Massariosphaeria phaeospora]